MWVARDQALWFTDIKRHKVHRYTPATGEKRTWDAPKQIGFVLPRASGGFIAGLQSGLYQFDETDGSFELIVEVEPERPTNRLNDGVADSAGRLWFGTMDDGESDRTGSFYSYHHGRLSHTGIKGIAITNGPAISPDQQILYWVDTLQGAIFKCDIAEDGSVGRSREFAMIAPDDGYPDGPTIDSEGHVWISLYGGWEARRYSPDGELVDRIKFPVANVTKIAFGGSDLCTIFATTARQLLSPAEIAKQPQIGGLFEFQVEVAGVPCPLLRG